MNFEVHGNENSLSKKIELAISEIKSIDMDIEECVRDLEDFISDKKSGRYPGESYFNSHFAGWKTEDLEMLLSNLRLDIAA